MFGRKKRTGPQQKSKSKPKPASKASGTARPKLSVLSLESRLMFDAAAAATAAEVNQEQVAQEQAESVVSGDNTSSSESQASIEGQDLLRAITNYSPGDTSAEIAFVDPTVPDYQSLIAGMGPNVQIVLLDGGQDGMEQIAASLAGRTGIDAIHIISHGAEGQLSLGTGTLSQASMTGQYADELATIKQALSEQADILVYGCDFAEGQIGQEAATLLSQLTGADVAASTDDTGAAGLGGDWELEVQTGAIETQVAIDYDTQMDWVGVLDISTGLLGQWTFDTNANDSSGNNYNGTLTNGAAIDTTDATDMVGTAKLSLDGTNDYVDLSAHLANFTGLTQGTISAWIKTTDTLGAIVNLSDVADAQSWTVLGINGGKLQFQVIEASGNLLQVTSVASVNDNAWHHVAITVDATGNKLYIDGQQAAVTYTAGSSATQRFFSDVTGEDVLQIGVNQYNGGFTAQLGGLTDDVRLYNRALTEFAGNHASLAALRSAARGETQSRGAETPAR